MISISGSDIYNKVLEFSSFEAGRGVAGDALYSTLLVNTRDKAFIDSYSAHAQSNIGATLHFCLEDYYYEEGNYSYEFRPNCTISTQKGATRLIKEAMVLSVMSQWLANKLPERAQAYAAMYTDLLSVLIKSVKKLNPVL